MSAPCYYRTGASAREAETLTRIRGMEKRINRFIRRLVATEKRPDIRWDGIERIEALGTDALGAFEISLTFFYRDGAQIDLCPHHRDYDEILDELPRRFPTIELDWFEKMRQQPWHVERVLYSASAAGFEWSA